MLTAMTFIAFAWYCVIPFQQEVYCDVPFRHRNSLSDKCDVYGRNETEPFQVVLRNVDLVSIESSDNKARGTRLALIRLTIRRRQMLDKFGILEIRTPE